MTRTTWLSAGSPRRPSLGGAASRATGLVWVAAMGLALALLGPARMAWAQGDVERLRIQEAEQRRRLSETEYLKPPRRKETAFNFGGWSSTSYYMFKDDDNKRDVLDTIHGLFLTDFRLWVKWATPGNWGYYLRGRKINHAWILGVSGIAPNTDNLDSYDLDVGYIDAPAGQFRLRLGRQLIQAGRGLALSDNLDSLSIRYRQGPWALLSFFGRTPPLEDNLDTGVAPAGAAEAQRNYTGIETSYSFESGRRIYGYAVVEDDQTLNLNAANQGVNHEYNANYLALGADGPINRKLLGYGEFIRQTGRTFSQNTTLAAGQSARDEIDAFAFISAFQYFFGDPRQQTASVEYSLGSGDKDRGTVPNVFESGNLPNTRDTSFNYFGFYDLGLALSPRLSNLEVWRLGYSAKPFLNRRRKAKEIQIGAKGTLYSKEERGGAISATTSTQANRAFHDVGNAIDLFLAWRFFSDLSAVVQFGRFNPGAAYSPGTDGSVDRVFLNMTASF